jgi:hypothetical protein
MYLVPSRIPNAGRGVVAGISFNKEDFIEQSATLPVPKRTSYATQLMHYVYGSDHEDYSMVILGPSSLYNHHVSRNVQYTWADAEVNDVSEVILPYTNMTASVFRVSEDISSGQEMLNFYGEEWFQRFEKDEAEELEEPIIPPAITEEHLEDFGHCLTDVIVGPSQIEGAGRGLFATRDFAAGEIITVSPVLALNKNTVDASASQSVLINYCLATLGSDLVLFPLNYAAMINHDVDSNVEIHWYDWSEAEAALAAKYNPPVEHDDALTSLRLDDKLRMTVRELTQAHFAQLDIAYTATRDVHAGEEILLDYGAAWQEAWEQYATEMVHWERNNGKQGDDAERPAFRHYMEIPEDMYSEHWYASPRQCPVTEEV